MQATWLTVKDEEALAIGGEVGIHDHVGKTIRGALLKFGQVIDRESRSAIRHCQQCAFLGDRES